MRHSSPTNDARRMTNDARHSSTLARAMTREDRAERGGASSGDRATRRDATTAQRLTFLAMAPVFALSFQLSIFASTDGARVERRARR